MSEVVVEGQSGSRQMTVQIGSLRLTVDRAAEDHELRSVDFMLAALGSCTLRDDRSLHRPKRARPL